MSLIQQPLPKMPYFPDEILCMICSQVWHQRDFDTLFNCACSGRQLAVIALMNLYRMPAVAVGFTVGNSDEDADCDSDAEMLIHGRLRRINYSRATWLLQDQILKKSAGFWRTIILSSLSKTLYPYAQYIRSLDLQDLKQLITNFQFEATCSKFFFQGELAQFKREQIGQTLDTKRIEVINTIGDVIMMHTPLLEELTGTVPSGVLSQWIPRLPRLTYLKTWNGALLDNGSLIRLHCPSFKRLHLPTWDNGNPDPSGQLLADFINDLRPQSIESLSLFTFRYAGPEIYQALSCHGESLTELKINLSCRRPPDLTIPEYSILKVCTNLVSLSLTAYMQNTPIPSSQEDFLVETFTWLKNFKKLRYIALFGNFKTAWITPILLENSICLTSFIYQNNERWDDKTFRQALASQKSLQTFHFKGEMHGYLAKPDFLVECLSQLVNLTDLRLEEVSQFFVDRHIVQLAGSLPKLEGWSTHGYNLTDAIWGEVASLRLLRTFNLTLYTLGFTVNGILNFIEKLGLGNKGFSLSLMKTDYNNSEREVDKVVSGMEQALIQEKIGQKLQGSFESITIWV